MEKTDEEGQEKRMKWGILATGNIAKKFADTVNQMHSPQEVLTAVGSRSLEHAESFAKAYGILHYYDSYEKLAQDPEVDAIYVATPNSMHYEDCKMCLNAGKHVLCEKPFTVDAGQAQELYELAAEKGLFIMEAFWIRFLPLYDKLREMLADGVIGQVRHVRCEYGFTVAGSRKDRKFQSALGGGALLDIGIYNLGFLHMIMGEAPEDFTTEVHLNEFGTDDFSVLQLRYPGGRTAHSLQTIGMRTGRNAAIFGSEGAIFLEDFQHAQAMTVELYDKESYRLEFPFEVNGFEYEIREVSRCVAEGRCSSDRFTPEDSLTVLRLMDDIRRRWNMKFACEK